MEPEKPDICPLCGEDRAKQWNHALRGDGTLARSGCHSYPNGIPDQNKVESNK